jgi:hypothetical protein
MSIDVDILPALNVLPSWKRLRDDLFASRLPASALQLLGQNPLLIEVASSQSVTPTDSLVRAGSYRFQLTENNTLGLAIDNNSDIGVVESDYLADFGENLSMIKRQELATRWRDVGYSCTVSSFAGRHRDEPFLLAALATVLASFNHGMVVVKSAGIFNLPVGCYTPEVFKEAVPTFFLADQ